MEENYLFEISWEVCNKVGGIHTVVASKVFEAQRNFSNYFCIGPYKNQKKNVFEELPIPSGFEEGAKQLKELGITIHYGTWNIEGLPEVILIDYSNYSSNVNECKRKLWELWGVDSLGTQWFDFDEPFLWSWVAGIVIEKLMGSVESQTQTLVHSHEWMSGGAIAYLKSLENTSSFATIFTTHATILGRTLFSQERTLDDLKNQTVDSLADEMGVKTKFQMERALAHNSDCFTTVSDITADEAEKIYEKAPDIITYNGFDSPNEDIYTLEKQFQSSRKQIDNFLEKYFYDFYGYSSNSTYLMFTSGRYELKNKGVDIIVEALAQLNALLQEENSQKQVIFWFMLMFGNYEREEKITDSFAHSSQEKESLKLDYVPLSPYKLPLDNELIKLLVEKGLFNNVLSPVKVIVTPNVFDGQDGLINLDYYDFISGFDLGVFPSLYEPWGYTPAEALAYGVPAISSDFCGIGQKACEFSCDTSFRILERKNSQDDEVISDLVSMLYSSIHKSPKEQYREKVQAKVCSQKFSWKVFYNNYMRAYKQAVGSKV